MNVLCGVMVVVFIFVVMIILLGLGAGVVATLHIGIDLGIKGVKKLIKKVLTLKEKAL